MENENKLMELRKFYGEYLNLVLNTKKTYRKTLKRINGIVSINILKKAHFELYLRAQETVNRLAIANYLGELAIVNSTKMLLGVKSKGFIDQDMEDLKAHLAPIKEMEKSINSVNLILDSFEEQKYSPSVDVTDGLRSFVQFGIKACDFSYNATLEAIYYIDEKIKKEVFGYNDSTIEELFNE